MMTDMAGSPHILVVDDDRETRELLTLFLERNEMRVTAARDGQELRRLWPCGPYQLVVLDLMLPGEGGLSLARWLRETSDVPLVMLTAMGEDDSVPKPFNPRELLARVRAVLRRTAERQAPAADAAEVASPGSPRSEASRVWRFDGWRLEPTRRRLLNPEGVEVPLTGGEYDLLAALVERANQVMTRDSLLELLRGRQAGPFDRAIDVAISRLRRKLDDDGRRAQLIKTVRGGGYVLAVEVERA